MATARVILDERRAKSNGLFPVKIRIANGRAWKLYGTSYSLSPDDFKKLLEGKRLGENLKPMKSKLDGLLAKANSIIDDMHPFSFDAFQLRFTQKGNKSDMLFLLRDKSERMRAEEKYGNANLYSQAAVLLERYNSTVNKSSELPITDITPKWLQAFELWASKLKRTNKKGEVVAEYGKTTLGMYLIRVRAIFNDAITNNEIARNTYPFHKADNKQGYKIPKGSNNKRALSMDEIMAIYNYETDHPTEIFARDMFLFSYLSSGMNVIDIFRLKWADVKRDHFAFVRKKTENKTGGANKIKISLSEDLERIIATHGTRKLNSGYVFDVIPANATEAESLQKVRAAVSTINVNLKKIAGKLGITEEISTYFARHSFATNLMNNEVPLAFISKQLGHTDLKTTQNYLDSFTTEKASEYQSNLLVKNKIA